MISLSHTLMSQYLAVIVLVAVEPRTAVRSGEICIGFRAEYKSQYNAAIRLNIGFRVWQSSHSNSRVSWLTVSDARRI